MVIKVTSSVLPEGVIPRGTKDHWVYPLTNLEYHLELVATV